MWSEPCFCFTVDFLSWAWSGKMTKCFHFRMSLSSARVYFCIFNIFKVKQKTDNPTLLWATFLKTVHQTSLRPMQTELSSMASLFRIHMMQSTWAKFMSLQFAWQPAFKSPGFAAPCFRVSFAVLYSLRCPAQVLCYRTLLSASLIWCKSIRGILRVNQRDLCIDILFLCNCLQANSHYQICFSNIGFISFFKI